jgi:hypothetical protein
MRLEGMTMDLAVWRDISLLWLIFLGLAAVAPFTVLFFYAIRGLIWLRQMAKVYLPIAQERTRFIARRTEEISQQVASPIIGVQTRTAQVNGITKAVFSRRKST